MIRLIILLLIVSAIVHCSLIIYLINMSESQLEFEDILPNLGDGEEVVEESDNGDDEKQVYSSAILLEDLLDNKEYRKFKDILQLPNDLEDNDDLKTMYDMAESTSGKSKSKTLFKNLFDVLCCLAGESLSSAPMSTSDQYLDYNVKFNFWLRDISMKEEFRNGLLRYFPNKNLPTQMNEYVKLMHTVPTANFIQENKIGHLSREQQVEVKFGAIIKTHFDACKREINTSLNRLWIEPSKLPSGVSKNAYTYFMRKQLWPKRALELAENAIKQAFKREHSADGMKYNKKDNMKSIMEQAEKNEFVPTWFPDYWLVFLFLGMPAGSEARGSFMSGEAAVVQDLSLIRTVGNKAVRRAIDVDGVMSPPEVGSSAKKSRRSSISSEDDSLGGTDTKRAYELTIRNGHVDNPLISMIANLKDKLSTMQALGIQSSDESYIQVLRKIYNAQLAYEKELDAAMEKRGGNSFETPL